MPSRVIGSTRPAASPTSAQRGPGQVERVEVARAQRRNRPRVRLERRALGDPRRRDPVARPRAQRAGGDPGVRLRADADGEMVGTRKRPDVAGRIGRQLDDDLVARDAVREEAGRDRQLIAAERRVARRRRTRLFAPSAPITIRRAVACRRRPSSA